MEKANFSLLVVGGISKGFKTLEELKTTLSEFLPESRHKAEILAQLTTFNEAKRTKEGYVQNCWRRYITRAYLP